MKLYNSLTKKKETFFPLTPNQVKMYVCGITPYDTTHIGHVATYGFFDVLHRFLKYKGNDVNYVQNITDVDDPLFKRSKRDNIPWDVLAEQCTIQFKEDLKKLNILPPTKFIKTSDEINSIKSSISSLIKSNNAYINKNVYFKASSFSKFGHLCNSPYETMLEKNPDRQNSLDFILWKQTDENPVWNSPWGKGRPGWHIECSTLATKHLGSTIDIHGGGSDLIYPHHEAEIAQSESLNHKIQFSQFWIHVETIKYKGEKMSKSKGNIIFVRDVLKKISPQALRLYLANNHYRSSTEYDEKVLQKYEILANTFKKTAKLQFLKGKELDLSDLHKEAINQLENDMNTPEVIKILQKMAEKLNNANNYNIQKAKRQFSEITSILGL